MIEIAGAIVLAVIALNILAAIGQAFNGGYTSGPAHNISPAVLKAREDYQKTLPCRSCSQCGKDYRYEPGQDTGYCSASCKYGAEG